MFTPSDNIIILYPLLCAPDFWKQGDSFYSTDEHTVYQDIPDPVLGPFHARNLMQRSSKRIADLAACGGAASSSLGAIYGRRSLRELVRACAGLPELHLSACPFNAAYYNAYNVGDGLGWHFDRSAFGVCIVLQAPGAGGEFDFHIGTRHASSAGDKSEDAQYRLVEAIVNGKEHRGVVTVEGVKPGSLVVFAGQNSLHRVSTVTAGPARVNAILTYETQPNQRPGAYTLAKFFGRNSDGSRIPSHNIAAAV
jgi:hypothetical protein